jgi:multidrug efflux system outer membrane protein
MRLARVDRRLRLACLSLALAGCTVVGPDYARPPVQVPATFRQPLGDAPATLTAGDLQWWRQFGDPTLDALVAEALAGNKTVQIAAANVQASVAVVMQARAGLYPQVGYQAGAARQRLSERGSMPFSPSIPNPQTAYQAGLGASWELDLWGRISRLSESARAELLANESARRGVVLSLVSAVANAYIQLLVFDEQLAIARRSLTTYAEAVRLFELQFKYGQISQVTVEQARSQYEAAAIAIPQIEREAALTEQALSLLLGRNPGPIARGKSLKALTLPVVPGGLPSSLLEQRPDIAQAEQQLIAANARIGAARAQYYPSISLTAALGLASGQLSNLFNGAARTWSFGGGLVGPIFSGGLIEGQVAQTEALQQAALLNYESVIQSAFADVDNALVSRQKYAEQVQAEKRRIDALSQTVRLATLRYNGGVTDYLAVLNAQQQLFPAELTYAQDLGQSYVSVVNLYKALGGGWVDAAAYDCATPGSRQIAGKGPASGC